jgi:hypothetical protein
MYFVPDCFFEAGPHYCSPGWLELSPSASAPGAEITGVKHHAQHIHFLNFLHMENCSGNIY